MLVGNVDLKRLADECYPEVSIAPAGLEEPTVGQKMALFRKWKQDDQGMSWCDFAKSAGISMDGCVMVRWCGIWLGIEKDGHTHS